MTTRSSTSVTPKERDGFYVAAVADLRAWTLRWGADAEVLEPAALRRAVGEALERAARAYRSNPNKVSQPGETGDSESTSDG